MSPEPQIDALAYSDAQARELAVAFIDRTTNLVADRFDPIDGGAVVRTPSLPDVWWLNHLRVTGPLGTGEVVRLADEHLAELPYRQLYVQDERTGRELEQTLRPPMWKMEREVLMALRHDPDRGVNTGIVIEVDEQPMLELMGRWHQEGPSVQTTPAVLAQLVEHTRREGRAIGDRNFAVPGERGELLALTKLRASGAIAQVEDVYTVPEARGRGYARALVSHAVAQARDGDHELIFIVADDNDWPKQLYSRIGFEPVGYTWAFHRDARQRA